MKTYIWKYLSKLTSNYHSGGGLLIIAESLDKAKELVSINEYIIIDKEPDLIIECSIDTKPEYIIFEDAGCC
jgi:hypothetical protein